MGDELMNEIDSAFASSTGGGSMDRSTFREVVNAKKLMELRLRKLIAEIQADYWLESKSPSGLVIQFCRRIQVKFSHADVEGAVKAAKALSHLLTRSQEELREEVERVNNMASTKKYGRQRY